VDDSSLMAVMKLIIAPATMPGSISGTVTLAKARAGDAPRLMAASSIDGLIWRSTALVARTP
jgi:hypothetical protein